MFRKITAFALTAVLAMGLAPAAAFAASDTYAPGSIATRAAKASTQASKASKASKAKTAKAARKAYKSYLANHRSIKYFKVVKMGNGGIPVLLCTKQAPFTNLPANYFISVNVVIYDKSKKSKVKDLGAVSTGGTAFQLHYAKGVLYGHRIPDAHTFSTVTVKNGHLSISGMYDDQYGPQAAWRHFKNYNPATGPLYSSKALGKKGTAAQYSKLVRKYGTHPLKLYKNTKSNRAKRI